MKSAFIRGSVCASVVWLLAGCSGGSENEGDVGGPPMPIPVASFSVSSASVAEGGEIEVEVTLSSPAPGTVVIPFTLTGTATKNSDYTSAATPLRIPLGSSSGTIYIGAIDDWGDEANETVVLVMGTPTHATVGDIASATVMITDTDVPTVSGRVTNAVSGESIEAGTVSVDTAATLTRSDGQYLLSGFAPAEMTVVDYEADGFVPQGRLIQRVAMANALTNVPLTETASIQEFAPSQPAILGVANSTARVQLIDANILEKANGNAPVGQATGRVTPLLPASNLDVLPGNYLGAGYAPIESFGALNVRFNDAEGSALDLAPGETATVRIPASTRGTELPASVPLFRYDPTTGLWQQLSTATLVGSAPSQYYEGTISRTGTWAAARAYSFVDVVGCVEDTLGTRIPDAVVTIEATSYASKLTAVTDAAGNFVLPMKPESDAFLQAIKGGAVSNSADIESQTGNLTVTPCLVLSSTNLSIKLTWGELPDDLDSHTLGANSDEHIYYASLGSLTERPYIALDVDDVTGFGPEVTTFGRLARNRRYSFYVHNFSGTYSPGQTDSPARVEITTGGTQRVFTPPPGESDQTEYWHVFDLTTNQACAVTIVPVQRFTGVAPANQNVGNEAVYCE